MIDGRTVMEVPDEERAANEIAMLWEYISRRLQGEHRTLLATDQMTPGGPMPMEASAS
jgi:chromosome partitioning protein